MGDGAISSGMPSAQAPQYPISSVNNALRLVLMFRDHRELRLSEVAVHLGVANSTAHRLLAMLQYHSFVRQDPGSKAYQAGPALVEVGLSVVRSMDIRGLARPSLERLAAATGETTHLAVLEGTRVRYLDAIESAKALRVVSRTGMTLPAHCTSVGKALLAQLEPKQVRELYRETRLAGETARSLRTRAALERELTQVRVHGYAVNNGESEDGVSSVAVAVHDPVRGPVAALSCAAPTSRMQEDRVVTFAGILTEQAEMLSGALG